MVDFPTIDPSLSSSAFVPSSGSSQAPVTSTKDNMSAYSANLANGQSMTIEGFSGLMLTTTNNANETDWAVQQFSANDKDKMYLASLLEFLRFLNLYTEISKESYSYSADYKLNQGNINTVLSSVNTYNNGVNADNSAVSTLNNAIATYNNSAKSASDKTTLQNAINTYLSYATPRDSSIDSTNNTINNFNTNQVPTLNTAITALRNQLIADGVPLSLVKELTTQDDTYPSTGTDLPTNITIPNSGPMSPITGFPAPSLTTSLPNTMNVKAKDSGAQILFDLFGPTYALMTGQFLITLQKLQNASDFTGFLQFIFNNFPFLPPSFYQPTPAVQLNSNNAGPSGSTGAGSGVSLATIITSLSNPLMEGIISQGKFAAAYGQTIQGQPPQVVNELNYLTLTLLSQIGLQAGSPSLSLLQGRVPFIDPKSSPVLAGLIGSSVAGEAVNAVSSGAVFPAVQGILSQAFPNLDQNALNDLTTQLSAVIELVVLQTGLVQLAQSLNAPSLVSQVNSTLATPTSNSQPTAADIVNQDNLREDIISNTANATNISENVLNTAINDAVASGQFDEQATINSLVQNGVDQNNAANAAAIMQAYLNSEIVGTGILDQTVASNNLNQSILANQYVANTIQSNTTNRELRDQLIEDIVAQGSNQQQAIATATLAVTGQSAPVSGTSSSLPTTIQNLGLTSIAGLGLSPSESQAFADNLVNTVIGPDVPGSQTSIRALMDSRVATILKGQDTKATDQVITNIQSMFDKSEQLSVFADDFRSLANTYVGLMYNRPQPSNYKKDVDIGV